MDEDRTDEVVEHIDRFCSLVFLLESLMTLVHFVDTGHYLQHQPSKRWMKTELMN